MTGRTTHSRPAVAVLWLLLALLGWGMLAGPGFGEDRERIFYQALDAFQARDYERSALLFESLLADGYENGAVLYNLGNAHMHSGHPGKAIAAYRRAQRLLPRDPYLDANLKTALEAAPSNIEVPAPPWWQRVLFWHSALSQRERQWLGAAAWTLAFLLAVLRLLLGERGRAWPGLRPAIGAALLLGLVASLSVGLGYYEEQMTSYGVVTGPVQARKGNGESYALAFDQALKEGAEFTVIELRGGWVRVRVPGVGEGWVPEKAVVVY